MSHGFELAPAKGPAIPDMPVLAGFSLLLDRFNSLLLKLSMAAMIFTALILTYSVFSRYFFNVPTSKATSLASRPVPTRTSRSTGAICVGSNTTHWLSSHASNTA